MEYKYKKGVEPFLGKIKEQEETIRNMSETIEKLNKTIELLKMKFDI